ncbi:hypothetical protein ANRL3_01520 [Anaerolineae bacterium]|nr:hypothetical protein ANRL3_01520 [Anaerolineae bacterium]
MEMDGSEGNARKLVACPFCNSTDTEMIALFGQQMMTSQYYCKNCRTGFEAVKWENSSLSSQEFPQVPPSNYE